MKLQKKLHATPLACNISLQLHYYTSHELNEINSSKKLVKQMLSGFNRSYKVPNNFGYLVGDVIQLASQYLMFTGTINQFMLMEL